MLNVSNDQFEDLEDSLLLISVNFVFIMLMREKSTGQKIMWYFTIVYWTYSVKCF